VIQSVKTNGKEMLGHRSVTWLVKVRGSGKLLLVLEKRSGDKPVATYKNS
jgi:hypothetical protein